MAAGLWNKSNELAVSLAIVAVSGCSLGFSFSSYFRVIWKAYTFLFFAVGMCINNDIYINYSLVRVISIAALVGLYSHLEVRLLVVQVMLILVLSCLVCGVPFVMALATAIIILIIFTIVTPSYMSAAYVLAFFGFLVLSHPRTQYPFSHELKVIFSGFLLYASINREEEIRTKFDTIETVKVTCSLASFLQYLRGCTCSYKDLNQTV